MIGERVGSYEIQSLLGEGGMGRVYLAVHPLIGRKAAVKVLLPEYSTNQGIVNRFFNEARTTALIKHPGLVDIFDFGYHSSGCAFIVMELLEGESLAHRLLRDVTLPLPEALEIGRQVATAVGAAHAKGIIHRDLKPDNIYLTPDAEQPFGVRAKVLDFGIAKLAGDSSGNKTRTGAVLGTPAYMSPEQCRDTASVDARSDVYSLGCILFQLLCGRTPFVSPHIGEVVAAQLRDPPPHPASFNPSLPDWLSALLLRTLAKQPGDRPASMADLAAELEGKPVRAEAASRPVLPPAPQHPTIPGRLGPAAVVVPTPQPATVQMAVVAPVVQSPAVTSSPSLPGSSTTISQSAGEVASSPPEPLSRRRVVAVVAGIAAALVVLGVVSLSGRNPSSPTAAGQGVAPSPAPSSGPAPAMAPPLSPPPSPSPAALPPPPVAAATTPVAPHLQPAAPSSARTTVPPVIVAVPGPRSRETVQPATRPLGASGGHATAAPSGQTSTKVVAPPSTTRSGGHLPSRELRDAFRDSNAAATPDQTKGTPTRPPPSKSPASKPQSGKTLPILDPFEEKQNGTP